MNIKQIISGVVSGYLTKLIQLVASVAIVPFLLVPEVLGVEDYGRAFSILGATAVIGIAVAGIHLAADRAIAQAVGRAAADGGRLVAEMLGSGTKVLALVNLVFAVPLIVLEQEIFAALGIPTDGRYRGAVAAAAAISFGENALYLLRAPLIARGDIAFVNLVGMLEITARTATLFVLFSRQQGSVVELLGIQAFFTLCRQVAYVFRLEPSDRAGFWRAPISSAATAVRYAGSVTLAEGSVIAVRNLPVMVASRFLGATEAGYVAIVANTLQGYFLQIFYSVVQPIALPIASRFTLPDARSPRLRGFMDVEATYALGVAIVFGQLIYWTPTVIPLWLGEEFVEIVLATQIMLAGSGVQTISILRRSVLIGQGVIGDAVPVLVASALASILLVVVGVVYFDSWLSAVVFSALYLLAASSLAVDRVFVRTFGRAHTAGPMSRILSVGSIFVAAGAIATLPSGVSFLESCMWAAVALGATLALAFLTIISPARCARLIDRLYRSRGVDLFD